MSSITAKIDEILFCLQEFYLSLPIADICLSEFGPISTKVAKLFFSIAFQISILYTCHNVADN